LAYAPMYETWSVKEDEVEFEILLDLGHGEDYPLPDKGWFFGVRIPMANTNEHGKPDELERTRLDAVENRIRAVLRNHEGTYVGRRTGAGNRDLLFYTEGRLRSVEDRIRVSIGTEILFISREDSKWLGYESLLPRPSDWRQIEDRKCIDALLNADAEPSLTHRIEHRVETSVPKGAEALERFFAKLGLVDITIEGSKPEIVVCGIQEVPLELDLIHRISWLIDTKSPKARGTYLGWIATPEIGEPPMDLDFGDEGEGAGEEQGLEALIAALISEDAAASKDEG
jgi:hypothetical protein